MRECDECTTCCVSLEIIGSDFYKLPGTPCSFLNSEQKCKRCLLFNTERKPKNCTSFQCAWLRGFGSEYDNPNINNLMVSINRIDNIDWIIAMETKKNAYKTTGKNILIDIINKTKLPVIVSDFDSKYPNDKGDYIIVHDDINKRCNNIKGVFLGKLNKNIKIYKIKNG